MQSWKPPLLRKGFVAVIVWSLSLSDPVTHQQQCVRLPYPSLSLGVCPISDSGLTSIESVMPSSHLILCHPLPLLPSIFPSIRVFSGEERMQMMVSLKRRRVSRIESKEGRNWEYTDCQYLWRQININKRILSRSEWKNRTMRKISD